MKRQLESIERCTRLGLEPGWPAAQGEDGRCTFGTWPLSRYLAANEEGSDSSALLCSYSSNG